MKHLFALVILTGTSLHAMAPTQGLGPITGEQNGASVAESSQEKRPLEEVILRHLESQVTNKSVNTGKDGDLSFNVKKIEEMLDARDKSTYPNIRAYLSSQIKQKPSDSAGKPSL